MRRPFLLEGKLDSKVAKSVSPKAAAEFLGVTQKTLRQWRSQGVGPRYVQYSKRRVTYPMSALRLFREANTMSSIYEPEAA